MPIRFRRPDCETTLSIATRKAGTPIACPKCGEEILVPAPGSVPEIDLANDANLDREAELLSRDGSGTAAVVAKLPALPQVAFEKPDFTRPPPAPPAPSLDGGRLAVPAETGLVLNRRSGVLLVVFAAAMAGLAFATGYLVGQ